MSNVYYTPRALKTLNAKLAYVKGKGSQKLAQGIAKAVEEGNTFDRLNSRTRYGTTIEPVQLPRKGAYKGLTGPPLAPKGLASRVISHFKAIARRRGGDWQVVAGWAGVTSKKGFPFLAAHDAGMGHNPLRPIFGISPRTHALIREQLKAFWAGFRAAK